MPFDLADYVRRSCAACGVPEHLEDMAVAARIAEIMLAGDDDLKAERAEIPSARKKAS